MRLSSRWLNADGRVDEATPGAAVVWPDPLHVEAGATLKIALDTDIMPVRIELRSYTTVDAHTGVPTHDADPLTCQTEVVQGQACAAHIVRNQIVIDLPPNVGPYLVLYSEWFVPTPTRENSNVSTYFASWGFYFK